MFRTSIRHEAIGELVFDIVAAVVLCPSETLQISCVIRLALIAHGADGVAPDRAIELVAKDFRLDNVEMLKQRLQKIARSNGGFGTWIDQTVPFQEGAQMALNLKRSKTLQDYMLPRVDLIRLQVRASLGYAKGKSRQEH